MNYAQPRVSGKFASGEIKWTRDNILENCVPEPNTGCLLWLGSYDSRGYARCGIKRKWTTASRVVLGLQKGDPLVVRHKCDNPACLNPEHLCTGTPADNVRDRDIRNRARKSQRGLPYGVAIVGKRFMAQGRKGNKRGYLGMFDTAEEAHAVAVAARDAAFGVVKEER